MKSGFVALIGRPNAGKSTLLNALVQQKVAIISPKPQTTRNSIRAIRTDADSQIIFVDTPGIHKPKHELGTQMNKEAYSAASGVDLIYYLVDGSVPFGSGDEFVLNTLRQMHLPVYLILNKIDLLEKEQLIDLLLAWQQRMDFKEIIPISAKTQTTWTADRSHQERFDGRRPVLSGRPGLRLSGTVHHGGNYPGKGAAADGRRSAAFRRGRD